MSSISLTVCYWARDYIYHFALRNNLEQTSLKKMAYAHLWPVISNKPPELELLDQRLHNCVRFFDTYCKLCAQRKSILSQHLLEGYESTLLCPLTNDIMVWEEKNLYFNIQKIFHFVNFFSFTTAKNFSLIFKHQLVELMKEFTKHHLGGEK